MIRRPIVVLLIAAAVAAAGCGGGDETAPTATTDAPSTQAPAATVTTPAPEPEPVTPSVDLTGIDATDAALISDYLAWTPLATLPAPELRGLGSAHSGDKRIFAGPVGTEIGAPPYAKGTVVVKEITAPNETQIAIMQKVAATNATTGGWRYVEYSRASGETAFSRLPVSEATCASCHAKAVASDWVFSSK